MGAGGGIGPVGRAFGGIAARSGAELTGESISSVASRPTSVSGSIAGEIANRSLNNYMPHLSSSARSIGVNDATGVEVGGFGAAAASLNFKDTQISGGRISTTAFADSGKTASVDLYNASAFEKPSTPHSVVSASDGSQWYQVASGDVMGAFYSTRSFSGDSSETALVAAAFPGAEEGTSLRTVGEGVIEASHPEAGNGLWYNSAFYQEPDAPHDNIQSADGVGWYAMQPHASMPEFESAHGGAV